MYELRYLVISLSLFLIIGDVQGFCQLTQANTWTDRIFAHSVNNHYELLLTDRLEINQQISLLCGGNQAVFNTTCQKSGKFNPQLPKANCTKAIPPSVVPSSSSICAHTMYHVGFWFGNTFMELYRNCYAANTMTAFFSISTVYPTYLNSLRPPTAFDQDGLISAADAASFQLSSIYNRFVYLFGSGQPYIASPQSLSFDRGHLTPVADYTFPNVLRQTNKYLNVVPQFYSINRSNWKIVENWVRDQKQVLNVCTGALGVLELGNTQIYLAPGKNPVPRWTYKIVHRANTNQKYVILTSNNGWETQMPNPASVCRVIACPSSLKPTGTGFTFCCDPIDFINRNVPNLRGSC
ncbi:uncharacterized protein LOC128257532 [Drosophila gunungcola]|uniref:uncharacterized protein LOC128257532 n=1 Tax=Drosophila gunungcola TaxID=103775 RepID=UPI0022E043DA|nr:uncharacterized protein LOC128257532 [Drosophila gunungcola]